MTAIISKWGNSLGVRLPKEALQNLHFGVGDKVNLYVDGEKVIIEPIKRERTKYDLNELVAKTPKGYEIKEEFDIQAGLEAW